MQCSKLQIPITALFANFLWGALPPVNLRAVCYQEIKKGKGNGKGGANSHHKVLYDNNQGSAKPAIHRLVHCGCVKCISGLIYEHLQNQNC